jgi:hypothetical protein
MSTFELTGKFVGDGAIAARGGRIFVAFKMPGQQRNMLSEVHINGTFASLTPIGLTPGVYYKDGACSLAFDALTGELLMLNTCSPNATTGGDARPVLWRTGIVIAPGGAADATLAAQVQHLISQMAGIHGATA